MFIVCSKCHKEFVRHRQTIKRSILKNGSYVCGSCIAKQKLRAQNGKDYWTSAKRKNHGEIMRASQKYRTALSKRINSGMLGKKHSDLTKLKMSKSRVGKTGPLANAWKGGKLSLVRRIKGILHIRYGWYKKVYIRDNFKCTRCASKKRLDAHHKIPISVLIKNLLPEAEQISSDKEKQFEWLIVHPLIVDSDLKNGITLCRKCHKKEHGKWGSHNAR